MKIYFISIFLLLSVGALFVDADNKGSLSFLIIQAEFCLKQARCALPFFRNSHDFPLLTSEITALQGLINQLKSGSQSDNSSQLTKQLLQHERTLTMLLYKLKHMHPIQIGNPDDGRNGQRRGGPWGKNNSDSNDDY